MNIENEIFKTSKIIYEKLIPFGFIKNNEEYTISKNILNNSFRIDVKIDSTGKIEGKVYDLSFNEEYTNFRIENQTGEFVNKIRDEFEQFLLDIKNNCTIMNYFTSNQANRITDLIIRKYRNTPEFIWEKFPRYGVFRNSNNKKWYGLIMNIDRSKIEDKNGEVEIINVKLDENKVSCLLKKKGYYPSYHMNKKDWITITLDDTLSDEEIMNHIIESYEYTEQVKEWIVPANPKYYDVINCFNDTDTILWKQSSNIDINDIVYLYVAEPYSAILYKCKALEVDLPYEYSDENLSMKKVMKIKLIKRYNKDEFKFNKLYELGVKAIRGPRLITNELKKELDKSDN